MINAEVPTGVFEGVAEFGRKRVSYLYRPCDTVAGGPAPGEFRLADDFEARDSSPPAPPTKAARYPNTAPSTTAVPSTLMPTHAA